MASVFSHPAALAAFAPALFREGPAPRVLWLGAACALAPDIDAFGFFFGVRYTSLFGHRGITHSLAFAALLAAGATFTFFRGEAWRGRRLVIGVFLFLCGASHGFFDAMTDGGRGIAFFAPLDDRRYFLPFRPIRVSPIGTHGFFGPRGAAILRTELAWIWFPCLALGLAAAVARGRLRAR